MADTGKKIRLTDDGRLANLVDSWAREHEIKSDPYLKGLVEALRTQKDRNSWLALDPNVYLPGSNGREAISRHKLITLINLLRNSLVFLPVALTWLSIGKATNAFAIYAKTNTLNIINFLDFWQNGYGVLDKKWAIGHIATIDFQIILAVIVLTILNTWLSQRRLVSQAEADESFMESRKALSLEISIHAHKSVLKNLKSFRSRVAEELALKVDGKNFQKIKGYES